MMNTIDRIVNIQMTFISALAKSDLGSRIPYEIVSMIVRLANPCHSVAICNKSANPTWFWMNDVNKLILPIHGNRVVFAFYHDIITFACGTKRTVRDTRRMYVCHDERGIVLRCQ